MKISIAMATYNGERFLQEQLDSLAAQTHLPYELVVGDDGSTDGTLDILESFARTAPFPVRIQCNSVNLGYGENFLRTASRCTSEWIAFCDQDDVWLPTKLERIAQVASSNPSVDWIGLADTVTNSSLHPVPRIDRLSARGWAWMPQSSPVRCQVGHSMAVKAHFIRLPWNERPRASNGRALAHDSWLSALGWAIGDRYFLNEQLTLFRRHRSATTYNGSPPNAESRCWGTSYSSAHRTFFLNRRSFWSALAEWCRSSAGSDSLGMRSQLLAGAVKAEIIARFYSVRANVYSMERRRQERIAAIFSLISNGAYLTAFGLTPLAKDLLFAVLDAELTNV